jgi:hypothetical protein
MFIYHRNVSVSIVVAIIRKRNNDTLTNNIYFFLEIHTYIHRQTDTHFRFIRRCETVRFRLQKYRNGGQLWVVKVFSYTIHAQTDSSPSCSPLALSIFSPSYCDVSQARSYLACIVPTSPRGVQPSRWTRISDTAVSHAIQTDRMYTIWWQRKTQLPAWTQ